MLICTSTLEQPQCSWSRWGERNPNQCSPSSNGILTLTGTPLPGTRSARKTGLYPSTHCSVLLWPNSREKGSESFSSSRLCRTSLIEKERLKIPSGTSYKKTRTAEVTICIIPEGLLDRSRQLPNWTWFSMSLRYCHCSQRTSMRLCPGRELLTRLSFESITRQKTVHTISPKRVVSESPKGRIKTT